ISRESMLLANNILLVVAMAAVMLGTLYPLVLDTLGLGKISVGPPYFEAVFFPVMAPALFLIAVGPLARWKRSELPPLVTRLRWTVSVSVASALLAPRAAAAAGVDGPAWRPLSSLGLAFGFWSIAGVVVAVTDSLRTPGRRFALAHAGSRARMQSASVWGMHLAHLGMGAFVVGVTLVNSYQISTELRAEVGHTIELGDYRLHFTGLDHVTGPNYDSDRGHFEVRDASGKLIAELHPEKRVYRASGQPMTEAAIDRKIGRA